MEKVIYLDNAATTFPKPEAVYTAMDEANSCDMFDSFYADNAAVFGASYILG